MDTAPIRPPHSLPPAERGQLLAQAQELEAAFLAEMLAHTGLGDASESFGGGAGEGQFASFLRQEQARAMVDGGGIGLAELIFNSLVEAGHDHRA